MDPGTTTILSGAAALGAVLLLIRLAVLAACRSGLAPPADKTRTLAVLEVVALDSRRRLHLICCDGRRVLLLTGGGRDQVVGWLDQRSPGE